MSGHLVRVAEVGDIHRSETHEFGRARTYRSTEMCRDGGEIVDRYESPTEIMARLADQGWEAISVVPDQYHTWIDIYLRRPRPPKPTIDGKPVSEGPMLHVSFETRYSDGGSGRGRVRSTDLSMTIARVQQIEDEVLEAVTLETGSTGPRPIDVTVLSWQQIDG